MNRTLILIVAVIAILVGTGFVMPAVAKLRSAGTLTGMDLVLLLFGVSLTLGGLVAGISRLRRPASRN